ncbi:MAG TPA: malic enzyme-like NAD(P)-binding protein [Clostridia bacterium]|nr:malic enzyme-like NAD(P)-binding protein [Clostridia bacterium]
MDFPLNVIIRLRLVNKPGALASVLDVIAREEGDLGGIDLVASSPSYVDREVGVRLGCQEDLKNLRKSLDALPGVQVVHVADRVMLRHRRGKIEIKARREVENREDLSLIYTPGVARVTEAIHQNPDSAYQFTIKGNAVAIITDGSAVLGLGNVGPLSALPVMEGKSVLFKKFAGIDAIPLCINAHSTQDIIDTVVACAPAFGGINLEDIAAPGCFEVEEKLRGLLDVPVFHDDQHGTAIVTTAGLLNALRVVNKSIKQVRVVVSGAGAAGVAIVKMLIQMGVQDIVVCDSSGVISRDNPPQEPMKRWLMENTNQHSLSGSLKEVVAGADVFVGVSVPNLLDREDVLTMADNPIVFAWPTPNLRLSQGKYMILRVLLPRVDRISPTKLTTLWYSPVCFGVP